MQAIDEAAGTRMESTIIRSRFLNREIKADFYLPPGEFLSSEIRLLLINDGQDLEKMPFDVLLENLYTDRAIKPLICCAIHAGIERKMEYGTARFPDYKKRGAKAAFYTLFILEELLPVIEGRYENLNITEKAFAGFSLGGLSALDIVWNHPDKFSAAAVFSGSLWWRSVDQHSPVYDDDLHRIMHHQIRIGSHHPGLKFFFQCGNLDESKDRNKNGIIDSIDDTLDLIKELEILGYKRGENIEYLELEDGRHDVFTWGRAFPHFLKWLWGNNL